MVKKRVPEWLNSSLWSSSTSNEDDHRLSVAVQPPPSSTTTTTITTTSQQSNNNNHNHIHTSKEAEVVVEAEAEAEAEIETHAPVGPSAEDISRQAQLLSEISKKVVNMRELRRIASQGIPDTAGIRSTVWKLLLGYLPLDRSLWPSEMAKKRSQYKQFKDELLMNPSEVTRRMDKFKSCEKEDSKCESRCLLSRSEITHGEHPLSLGKTSIWNQFFQDTEIIEQIDRDVKRTHPDMHFFSGDLPFAKSNQEALKNILIVFAKLNPGIRYVQGMNEILAPLFYVFRNDPDEEYAVNPQFYAFRWITLLLTQEFNFADSLHIWDTLLSDLDGPLETLLRVCCAMLILIRRRLLAGDFTSNLKLLQNYPPTNISHLLYVANKLRVQSLG
ncbi:TBC1 domain family member 13-like isoform X3 [Quercus lobata]|uniref:TBC1 domain family member 13-like isoform X3 n=1 Tax=Quercus lobata TaxID=97700 RepID=UPI001248298E|nr:TBC1 domain family member 13-like isoform X3 [Quercus lobata]